MFDKNKIKEKLEQEKKELAEELSRIGKFDPKTGDWEAVPEKMAEPEADQNDAADRFEDFEGRSSTLNVLEERWKSILQAIKNIGKKSFGKCEVCGKEIEVDRMEANPAARTCKEHLKK